jgi:hypothetical protein
LRFAFLYQMNEFGAKRLSLHAHTAEFCHVNAEEVLVSLEIIEADTQIGA